MLVPFRIIAKNVATIWTQKCVGQRSCQVLRFFEVRRRKCRRTAADVVNADHPFCSNLTSNAAKSNFAAQKKKTKFEKTPKLNPKCNKSQTYRTLFVTQIQYSSHLSYHNVNGWWSTGDTNCSSLNWCTDACHPTRAAWGCGIRSSTDKASRTRDRKPNSTTWATLKMINPFRRGLNNSKKIL